jgi:hypothetical protein
MDICSEQEPIFSPVVGDQLAACWLYQGYGANKAVENQEKSNG